MGFIGDGLIVPKFVETALDLLCSLAQNFAEHPNYRLPWALASLGFPASSSLTTTTNTTAKPLTHQQSNVLKAESPQLEPMLRGRKRRDISDLADSLARACRMILLSVSSLSLSLSAAAAGEALNLYSSFYELGRDLIRLASLTAFLKGEGFEVRLEDLIKRPTLGEQVAFLSSRRKDGMGGEVVGVGGWEERRGQEGNMDGEKRISLQKRAGRNVLNRLARRVGAGRARDV